MKIDQENWLPHLKQLPSDIKGYKTCTYLTALEGWRRGLKLKFHISRGSAIPPSIRFSLSDGEKEHYFAVARGDKVTDNARNICMEKPMTYKYLKKNNVPIPEGRSFTKEAEDEEIIQYAKELDFPLVIKPSDGRSGIGVITDIRNSSDFIDAVEEVRHHLRFKSVIVERFIKGADYRVYAIGNQVVGIYKRIEANVIGDGNSTINQLIKSKNKVRGMNPFIYNRPIKIDSNLKKHLAERDLDLESVPSVNERIYLRRQGEYLKERDPVDITDIVPNDIKDIAVKAMKSIPGLAHCDVDMLVNEDTGEAYVNEINSRPQISNHLFPLEGLARDIPKEVIDFYFPETKDGPRNDQLYYDFQPVFEGFKNMSIEEIAIPDAPMEHIIKRYRLSGKLKNTGFEKWNKRNLGRLNMNGYLKHLKNGETSIVVSGTESDFKRFRRILQKDLPNGAKIDKIKEFNSNKAVKIGFTIKKSFKSRRELNQEIKDLKVKEKKLESKIKKLEKKYKYSEDQYDKVINSTSWRSTKVVRKMGRIFKK